MSMIDDVMVLTETTSEKADIYIRQAKSIILNRLYPFGWTYDQPPPVPPKYEDLQVRIAVYLVNKEGAEGEKSHNEGGINRAYEDGGVPTSLLSEITPLVKVL